MHDILIEEQATKICEDYKISKDDAIKALKDGIHSNHQLQTALTTETTLDKIYRTRVFKDFIKKVKKEIYFGLRTYQKKSDSLVDSHISTLERSPYINSLISQVEDTLLNSNVVLDLGGGMFPASLPIEMLQKIYRYIWIDKDKTSFEKLSQFKDDNSLSTLELYNHKIGEKDWAFYLDGSPSFDFVFMLKLVPVIARQEKELLTFIATIPAKFIFVSGSKEAMVKKQNIESRENKIITDFIKNTGKAVVKRIDIDNEFGYLIA